MLLVRVLEFGATGGCLDNWGSLRGSAGRTGVRQRH